MHEPWEIKPTMKQTIAYTRIAALQAKLWVNSHPKEGDVKRMRKGLPKNQHGGETEAVTCKALGAK